MPQPAPIPVSGCGWSDATSNPPAPAGGRSLRTPAAPLLPPIHRVAPATLHEDPSPRAAVCYPRVTQM
jgi:hypothetical protein